MAPTDPLFAVRVVSDGPGIVALVLPSLFAIGAVALGSWRSYVYAARIDRERDERETRQLIHSVVAEVRAGLDLVQLLSTQEGVDQQYRDDTMRFIQMPVTPLPITSEAAKRVGRFATPVAVSIARQLVLMAAMKQNAEIVRNMHTGGVLTDEKLRKRMVLGAPLAKAMLDNAGELERRVIEFYGATRSS